MKTHKPKPLNCRISWLAALFASHADYAALALSDNGILLRRGKSAQNPIAYLSIGPGMALERGHVWDVLAIHLENGQVVRFGGVSKRRSGQLQAALNHRYRSYIGAYYQRLQPELQQARQEARELFSGQRYIRHATTQQWLNRYRHLAEGINRRDIQQFLPPEALQCLQTIRPLLVRGHEAIAERNEAYVQRQLAAFQGVFDRVESNPLPELLLPQAERFVHAEERRLFYVALTRAKHHVYLVSDMHKASVFVRELIANKYEILGNEFSGKGFQHKLADIPCKQCKTGYLIPRDSRRGSFFGCSQYPLCDYTQAACQWCGGGLKERGRFRICENPRCDYVEPVCPKCGGTLHLRKGPSGQFWSCARYRQGAGFSCAHTEKFIDLKASKRKILPDKDYIT